MAILWAYANKKGNCAIPAQFEAAYEFSSGLALVKTKDKYVFINKSGSGRIGLTPRQKYTINPMFAMGVNQTIYRIDTWKFSEGLFPVKVGSGTGFINTRGALIDSLTLIDLCRGFSEGLAPYYYPVSGWGYIKRAIGKNRFVISHQYRRASAFSQGLAAVGMDYYVENGRDYPYYTHLIDKKGKTHGGLIEGVEEFLGFSHDLAGIKTSQGWQFITKNPKVHVNGMFEGVHSFSEKLAAVKQNGLWGFIDTAGTVVIAPAFADAGSFSDHLAPVKVDGKWGYINPKGKLVIKPQFEAARSFSEGLAAVAIVKPA